MDRLAASTSQPPPPPPGLPPPEPAVSEEINHWSMLADNMQSSSLRSFENIESYLSQDLLRVTAQNKGMYIALWTVDDVTGKDSLERPRGVFTASVGAFHMERPLKLYLKKHFGGLFRRNAPTEAVKTPRVFSCDIIDGP